MGRQAGWRGEEPGADGQLPKLDGSRPQLPDAARLHQPGGHTATQGPEKVQDQEPQVRGDQVKDSEESQPQEDSEEELLTSRVFLT